MATLLEQLEKRDGAAEGAIDNLLQWGLEKHDRRLPSDYIEFLRESNGTIGKGPDLYIVLDKAEEVAATTEGYGTSESAPGLVIIGSDGLGNLIGIDCKASTSAKRYLRADPLSIAREEQQSSGATFGATLLELLQAIAE